MGLSRLVGEPRDASAGAEKGGMPPSWDLLAGLPMLEGLHKKVSLCLLPLMCLGV